MGVLQPFFDAFWTPRIWLPPNTTWADIAPGARPDVVYPDHRHLLIPIPLALVLLLLRTVVERFWLAPIGRSLGIKSGRPKKPSDIPELEELYKKNNVLDRKTTVQMAKKLDKSERQIQIWWRIRRAQGKPSTLTKFCECSWRCIYYTFSFSFGLYVLWDKAWLWDILHCWHGFPHQSLDNDIWWYYILSMSFYWSLTFSQFVDVKRKDFWQMFVHHMATLLLMVFSWVCNLQRVGSLVLIVHDFADIFLDGAKLTKYANYQKVCDCIFAFFTIVWIITRLGCFPRIIYSSAVEATYLLPMFPAYYIFNGLLILLLLLHIAWTYLILLIVKSSLKSGQMDGDIRSSSSEVSESEEMSQPLTNGGTPKKQSSLNNNNNSSSRSSSRSSSKNNLNASPKVANGQKGD